MPTGVPNAGTPHAIASITLSPKPSAWEGTSTALAALIQYGTSSGGDLAHLQQRRVAGRLPRAVEALERARGVVREEQVGPVGVQPEALARLARGGSAGSAPRSMPTGSTATRRVVPAPGMFSLNSRDTAAGSATNGSAARVIRFERGWKRSLPCSVTTTGPRPREQRGPRRQAEVGVHDVEALAVGGGARSARAAAG